MMFLYGTELLSKLSTYYGGRLKKAKEHGYASKDADYHWLYQELEFRVKLIREVRYFIDILPEFQSHFAEDTVMEYVVGFTAPWFTEKYIGTLPSDESGDCPYFTDENPYWDDISEVMDCVDTDTDFTVLPVYHLFLCEYIVRNLRLYLFLREHQFRPVDQDRFDCLMALDEV